MKLFVTTAALEALPNGEQDAERLALEFAQKLRRLGEDLKGKFNRYLIPVTARRIVIVFLEEDEATVLTYNEALALPGLGQGCRERWKE